MVSVRLPSRTGYDRKQKEREYLSLLRMLVRPFMSFNRSEAVEWAMSYHRREITGFEWRPVTNRVGVLLFNADYFGANSGVEGFVVYISTQVSPIRVYQVLLKYAVMLKAKRKYPEAKLRLVLIARKITSGARALARKLGILVFNSVDEFLEYVADLTKKRHDSLLRKIAENSDPGKRIVYNELALFVKALRDLIRCLGKKISDAIDENKLLQAVFGKPYVITFY